MSTSPRSRSNSLDNSPNHLTNFVPESELPDHPLKSSPSDPPLETVPKPLTSSREAAEKLKEEPTTPTILRHRRSQRTHAPSPPPLKNTLLKDPSPPKSPPPYTSTLFRIFTRPIAVLLFVVPIILWFYVNEGDDWSGNIPSGE